MHNPSLIPIYVLYTLVMWDEMHNRNAEHVCSILHWTTNIIIFACNELSVIHFTKQYLIPEYLILKLCTRYSKTCYIFQIYLYMYMYNRSEAYSVYRYLYCIWPGRTWHKRKQNYSQLLMKWGNWKCNYKIWTVLLFTKCTGWSDMHECIV